MVEDAADVVAVVGEVAVGASGLGAGADETDSLGAKGVGAAEAVLTLRPAGGAALLPVPCMFCETMIWAGELSGADAAGLCCAHPAALTSAAATDTPSLFHVFIQGPGFCAPRRTPAVDDPRPSSARPTSRWRPVYRTTPRLRLKSAGPDSHRADSRAYSAKFTSVAGFAPHDGGRNAPPHPGDRGFIHDAQVLQVVG